MRYWAFISYSHADEAVATWLHRALETYRLPSKLVGTAPGGVEIPQRLFPIFRDRDELASAGSLGEKIHDALAHAESLIVIASRKSATSHWVNEEIRVFKALGKGQRVFCVIADGEPYASDQGAAEQECFPKALRYEVGSDGQLSEQRAEPIAADLRSGKDGKRAALLKIVAGILNIGLDALKQRDLQRRQRRLTAIAVAAVAASIFTTGLSVVAVQARNEALVQRQLAEARQTQAEGLIQFMLGDLRKKLEPIGKLDILDAVGEQAIRYFGQVPPDGLGEAELLARAEAAWQIGEVRILTGDLDGARAVLDQALIDARYLVANEPQNVQRIFQWGQVAFWRGEVESRAGRFDEVLPYMQEYLRAAQASVKLAPTAEHRTELASAQTNIGVLLFKRDRHEEALQQLERGEQGIFQVLMDLPPSNPHRLLYQQILGWKAEVLKALQRSDEEGDTRRKVVDISREMLRSEPDNQVWQANLGKALQKLASANVGLPIPERLAITEEAEQRLQAAHRHDPENAEWGIFWVSARRTRASLLHALGRPEASALLSSTLQLALDMAEARPELENPRQEVIWTLQLLPKAVIGDVVRHRLLTLIAGQPGWRPYSDSTLGTLCRIGFDAEQLRQLVLACPSHGKRPENG